MAPGVRHVGGVLGVRPDGGWSTARAVKTVFPFFQTPPTTGRFLRFSTHTPTRRPPLPRAQHGAEHTLRDSTSERRGPPPAAFALSVVVLLPVAAPGRACACAIVPSPSPSPSRVQLEITAAAHSGTQTGNVPVVAAAAARAAAARAASAAAAHTPQKHRSTPQQHDRPPTSTAALRMNHYVPPPRTQASPSLQTSLRARGGETAAHMAAQQRWSLVVCVSDRRGQGGDPATGARLGARGRLLAFFSFREQEQVSWRSVFCSVFPRFLKKNKTDCSLSFPGVFIKKQP